MDKFYIFDFTVAIQSNCTMSLKKKKKKSKKEKGESDNVSHLPKKVLN